MVVLRDLGLRRVQYKGQLKLRGDGSVIDEVRSEVIISLSVFVYF